MIRTVWVALNLFWMTLVLGIPLILGPLLRIRRQSFYDFGGRNWSRFALLLSGTPVRVEGMENVDPDSPQVLVGNHQSWYDVFALAGNIPKTFHFVAKKELQSIPVFGPAWKAAGHIAIDRSDRSSAIRSLEQAAQRLEEEGSAVVMFAEGTRSPDDRLLPFKKGPFMLAIHAGVPIVPFALAGTRRVFPKGSWRVRPGPIILRFGKPIPTHDLSPEDRETLIHRVRAQVLALRDGARRELGPGTLENPETET